MTLVRWFAREVQRVYAVLLESDDARDDRQLLELIDRKGGRITPRELQQSSRRYATAEAAEAALELLVKAGKGRWEPVPPSDQGGRPTRAFTLSTASTVYGTPENPGKNIGSVDVDSVDVPEINLDDANAALAEAAEEVGEWIA